MTTLGVDVSHFQGFPNFGQVKGSGRAFAVLKATEGTTFVDPNMATNRRAAHAAGMIVGLYHFARAGNAAAEAAFFVKTVGALQPGEFLVLDQEVPNSVAWCQQWLDAVHAATAVRPLIYMNQSATTGLKLGNWSAVAANYGLWLAVYDNSTAQPSVPYWNGPAMKQYWDKATVPGISGPVDVDVFYGTTAQLLAYCKGGASPTPAANVLEDDMALISADQRGTTLVAGGYYLSLTADEAAAWIKVQGPPVALSTAEYDTLWGSLKRLPDDGTLAVIAHQLTDPQAPDNHTLNSDLRNTIGDVEDKLGKIAAAVTALTAGGIDPATVIAGVLAGLNGAQINVAPAKS